MCNCNKDNTNKSYKPHNTNKLYKPHKRVIKFYFNTKDPKFITNEIVVNKNPSFISHSFVECPIYNKQNVPIGFGVSDEYIKEVNINQYIIRIYNTYTFNMGSISWEYAFKNNTHIINYPIENSAMGRIVSGTGEFANIKGYVKLIPNADGMRYVKIKYIK